MHFCWHCGLMAETGSHDPETGKFDPSSVYVSDAEIDAALARTNHTVRAITRANIALGKHVNSYEFPGELIAV